MPPSLIVGIAILYLLCCALHVACLRRTRHSAAVFDNRPDESLWQPSVDWEEIPQRFNSDELRIVLSTLRVRMARDEEERRAVSHLPANR
jgi:hypothetical protein